MRLLINDRPWILLCLSFWKFYWLPSAANGQDPQDGNNNNHRREKSLHHLPLVVSYRPIWPISNYGPIPMANYLPFYWHYSQHPATLTNIQRARQVSAETKAPNEEFEVQARRKTSIASPTGNRKRVSIFTKYINPLLQRGSLRKKPPPKKVATHYQPLADDIKHPKNDKGYESCTDSGTGLLGVCLKSQLLCSRFGGRPSGGVCSDLKSICCINTLNKCGDEMTLNNTYWQSSHTVGSASSCSLTVVLDDRRRDLMISPKEICQIRLDFVTFSISQPNAETVCNVDTFQVTGVSNKVPVICGDNHGQHMYLTPSSSTTDLQLVFNFGQSVNYRSWNILVSMIPCCSSDLAPQDCLQYFTTSSGIIRSFNWKDVAGTTTRQLANQDYKICFRAELLETFQPATTLCLTPCTVFSAPLAFSLSQSNTASTGLTATSSPGLSQSQVGNCNNDYLIIPSGYNPSGANSNSPVNTLDRYCGERLNPIFGDLNSVTVCTQVKSFSVYYRTNADETVTPTVDGPAPLTVTNGNLGFCLSFQQQNA